MPVNAYRWFRGFNEYDNWQASGVSGQGARSFYYPPKPQQCADCHMPLVPSTDPAARDGKVHSHRFAAANTALPFVNRDPEQLKAVQTFLQDGAVTVDVFGIVPRRRRRRRRSRRPRRRASRRLASTFAVGEESMNFGAPQAVLAPPADVAGPLDKADVGGAPGRLGRASRSSCARARSATSSRAGPWTTFDVWVELEATDDNGRNIFHSGGVADEAKGPVDPGAHFYRSLLLDGHGNPINKRNAWAARSVAYVRLIPPGAADTIHYRLRRAGGLSATAFT